uniref:DUF5710 domain-containing protein n=1 Tax=Chromera velia CCMP2878 TaxID=1169474 RepID=A0A0G4I8M5_9ALVE|eukprot:Cvel_11896.t1-p1 / transcript=Cvel_11896.t1 / gene=Cvel_11896 / organism=Chromera_velia_CCMP2878 / gene_product=DNA primase TraC, putative / transcript_product=DNA primase TraC, putative / location=Cvel_scaffold761:28773-29900(-) / protein_length=376 / sequence_SO=supercontig / SO=protein_coding / is_pseudo=false
MASDSDRTYLNCPFEEKEDAKALGARWDPDRKKWYVPAPLSLDAFSRWLPSSSSDNKRTRNEGDRTPVQDRRDPASASPFPFRGPPPFNPLGAPPFGPGIPPFFRPFGMPPPPPPPAAFPNLDFLREADGRLFLECPYEEKEDAKALGARWDNQERKWYIPPQVPSSPFARWIPIQCWARAASLQQQRDHEEQEEQRKRRARNTEASLRELTGGLDCSLKLSLKRKDDGDFLELETNLGEEKAKSVCWGCGKDLPSEQKEQLELWAMEWTSEEPNADLFSALFCPDGGENDASCLRRAAPEILRGLELYKKERAEDEDADPEDDRPGYFLGSGGNMNTDGKQAWEIIEKHEKLREAFEAAGWEKREWGSADWILFH